MLLSPASSSPGTASHFHCCGLQLANQSAGNGQLTNGSLADYLVPLSSELPDIEVAHVETPSQSSEIGAKGAGEAGTAASPAAIMNAVNDAIAPLGGRITTLPMTPERILRALNRF